MDGLRALAICLLAVESVSLDASDQHSDFASSSDGVVLLQTSQEVAHQGTIHAEKPVAVHDGSERERYMDDESDMTGEWLRNGEWVRHSSLHRTFSSMGSQPAAMVAIIAAVLLILAGIVVLVFKGMTSDHGSAEDTLSPQTENSNRKCPSSLSTLSFLFLFMLANEMCLPALTRLFVEDACAKIFIPPFQCYPEVNGVKNIRYIEADQLASLESGKFYFITGFPQVFACALFGVLGDAFGRRCVVLTLVVGQAARGILLVACRSLDTMMYLGGLTSFCGGTFAMLATAFATMADIAQHDTLQQRALKFGLVESAFLLATILGPVLGGASASTFGIRGCFAIVAALGVLNLIIVWFTFEETLEDGQVRPFSWARANPVGSMLMLFETTPSMILGFLFLIMVSAAIGTISFLGLYEMQVVQANPLFVGMTYTVCQISRCFGVVFMLPFLLRVMQIQNIMTLSCLNGAVQIFMLSCAASRSTLLSFSALIPLGSCFYPLARIGITNIFGHERFGEALAAVGLIEQICYTLAPGFVDYIYSITTGTTLRIGVITVHAIAGLCVAGMYLTACAACHFVYDIPVKLESCEED